MAELAIRSGNGSTYLGFVAPGTNLGRFTNKADPARVYSGQITKGAWTGHGVWECAERKEEGQFVDGSINGFGMMTYKNGTSYQGEFNITHYHGKGRFIDAHGKITDSIWQMGANTNTPCDMTQTLKSVQQGESCGYQWNRD